MTRKLLTTAFLWLLSIGIAFGQSGSISGTVTDAQSGNVLPGANVVIKELQRGSPVNSQGKYKISNVPAGSYTLTVSFIGYNKTTKTVKVASGEQSKVNFALQQGVNLGEVVVTALGQEQSEAKISFASQEISDEQLDIAQSTNIQTGLAGKVSGVQIVGQAGSKLGAFGNIRIRGAISLTDELAHPLYVVNGTPVNNPNMVNMSNVKSINVLKGPNATALYGQRGDNGVVIITTKGANQSGVSVSINNSTTFEQVRYLPEYQNQYGHGYGGESEWLTLDYSKGADLGNVLNDPTYKGITSPYPSFLKPLDGERYIRTSYADESWGPEFDGKPYIAWYNMYPDSPYYGQTSTWQAHPNNVRNFFDLGVTSQSGFAINYGTDSFSTRIAYTNLSQGGIIPYSNLQKHYFSGRFNYDVTEDFDVGFNINYSTQNIDGQVRDDGYSNQTSGSFNSWFNRNLDMSKMRELKDLKTPRGYTASWNNWGPGWMAFASAHLAGGTTSGYFKPAFWYNPYTWQDQLKRTRGRDNLLVSLDLTYQLSDQFELSASANTTTEDYNTRFELPSTLSFSAAPSLYNPYVNSFGVLREENTERNFETKLSYEGDFGDISVDVLAGGHARLESFNHVDSWMDRTNYQNGGLIIPDLYNFGNSAERMIPVERNWNKQVLSMFSQATIGYKDFLYLDASYRRDYSSALPSDNNGYGYPSVGLSFVFSDLIDMQSLSYGKIRIGYAEVGDDVSAEMIDQTYNLQQDPFTNPETSKPTTLLSTSGTLVDPEIRPALNSSFETGFDIRFFNDRVGLNATYYNEMRKDEIIPATMSSGTGYTAYLTNAGSSKRQGVELSLESTPVQNQNFRWDATVNWATNETIVQSLPAGLKSYEMGLTSAFGFISVTHRVGEEWGQLRGAGIRRNEKGTPIVNPKTGKYAVEQNKYFGSVLPDWTGGFVNTFTFKNLSLTAAIDFQKGGKFFSLSEQWGEYSGLLKETAGKNDLGNPKRDPIYDSNGNMLPKEKRGGIHVTGVSPQGNKVDTYISAKSYYKQWNSNSVAEPFIHDASYVKLRELNLSYNLPKSWLGGFVKSAKLGVVGRNLWMIALAPGNVHNWDPSELAQVYGENGQLPGTQSYGFNVKVTF